MSHLQTPLRERRSAKFEISQICSIGRRQPSLRWDDCVHLERLRAAFCRSAAGLLHRKERWSRLPMVYSKMNLVEGLQP